MPEPSSTFVKGVKQNSLLNNVTFTLKSYQPCKKQGTRRKLSQRKIQNERSDEVADNLKTLLKIL